MLKNLVSVCIPAFNAGKYITDTLQCILKQSYHDIEIIVVDDCSTDDTFSIISEIASQNKNIKVFKQVNSGAAAARNSAFKHSNGEFIVFFDADDLADKHFIQTQVQCLSNNDNESTVCIAKWGRFYQDLNTYLEDPNQVKRNLTFYEWITIYWPNNGHMTPPGRVMLHRKTIEQSGLWNEGLTLNDDFDFFTRAFSKVKTIIYNNHTNFYYRSGIGGLSQQKKSLEKQQSNFSSIDNSAKLVMTCFPNDKLVKCACANVYQAFLYEAFPFAKDLCRKANEEIKKLGGSNLPYQAGGISKILYNLFGWEATNRIKHFLGK